ncbi:MAG: ROK family protein [Candidatus Aminicenantales bacterium]
MKEHKYFLLGIDLGGTKLRFILADYENGNITNPLGDRISKISIDSPLLEKEGIFDNEYFSKIPDSRKVSAYIIKKLHEYLENLGIPKNRIKGIGISVAGKIQKDRRFIGSNVPIKYAVKKEGYYGINLISELAGTFPKNIKIAIENDATCAGIAQGIYYKYMGIDPDTTFYVTVGTGIGGGGPKRDVDEIGHIIMDGAFPPLAVVCGCGATGCVETYASGEGLKNQALSILNFFMNDPETFKQFQTFENIRNEKKYDFRHLIDHSILKPLYLEKKEITAKQIFDSANLENPQNPPDPFALYLIETAAERIAQALISLSNIHGIERFGFGGSVAIQNPKFLNIIQEKISSIYKCSEDIFKKKLLIEISPLGESANDYGALFLVVPPDCEKKWIDTIIRMRGKSAHSFSQIP